MLKVRTATTSASSPRQAADELATQAALEGASVALVFSSPSYDGAALVEELSRAMGSVPVFGCTTAGEISGAGFAEGSAVMMTLKAPQMRVGAGLSCELSRSPLSAGREAAQAACRSLGLEPADLKRSRHVAVSFIDGRSGKEESFIAGAASTIPQIDIVGGSASDEVDGPPRTRVFAGGKAYEMAGLLLIFETTVPFTVVMSEHMIPTDKRVVVTDSDPSTRTVHELNGRPAVDVYQELLQQEGVDSQLAGRNPFAQYLGGRAYIRSVMEVQGKSLRFACAVENGVILRLVEPGDMVERTADALGLAAAEVGGEIGGLIAFNCLGRFLETEALGTTEELASVMSRHPVVGFNTFGEQAGALHVNHTLTALAFGRGYDG